MTHPDDYTLLSECLSEIGQTRTDATLNTSSNSNNENKYRQIFRLREVHYLAAFVCLYIGTEVTVGGSRAVSTFRSFNMADVPFIQGWIVSYIEAVRGGGDNSGYVSSGFFGGRFVVTTQQLGI